MEISGSRYSSSNGLPGQGVYDIKEVRGKTGFVWALCPHVCKQAAHEVVEAGERPPALPVVLGAHTSHTLIIVAVL